MIKNRRLAKLTSDRAIGNQKLALKSKLGPRYIEVSNRREGIGGNSQTCTCGAKVPKGLKERVHRCPECGLIASRDHVSANIVSLMAFGHADISLSGSRKNPASGLDVVRRGGDKVPTGESRGTRQGLFVVNLSLEFSMKRRPLVQGQSTTGISTAKATVGGKTRGHDRARPVLAREPGSVRGVA